MYFHEYANEIIFISDHATMTKLDENSIFIFLMIFPLFFSVFTKIHEYGNYANIITCFDYVFERPMS